MRIVSCFIAASLVLAWGSACSTPPTPGLSEVQKIHITDSIAGLSPGTAHPDYTYVPMVEWGAAIATCMRDGGYDTYSATTTSFARRNPGNLDALERRTLDECVTVVQIDPVDVNFLSVDQLDYVYHYYQQRLVPCLAAHGIVVSNEPSRAEFLATIFLDDEFGYASWSPYQEVDFVPRGLFDACPPSPPGYAYALEDWRQ